MESKVSLKDLIHWEEWYAKTDYAHKHFRNKTALYTFIKKHREALENIGAVRRTPRGVMLNELSIENAILGVI